MSFNKIRYIVCAVIVFSSCGNNAHKSIDKEPVDLRFEVLQQTINGNGQDNTESKQSCIGYWASDLFEDLTFRICEETEDRYLYQAMDLDNPNRWVTSEVLMKKKINGGVTIFESIEHTDKVNDYLYYMIDDNGNLMEFDQFGYIATYPKIL